ncbi:MAG: hypothetical protein ACR2G0_06840 [Chthoniobacterales bacterium]
MQSREVVTSNSVIAYWLLPASTASAFFQATIRGLASECEGPLFEPHLTLAVGPDISEKSEYTRTRIRASKIELAVAGVAYTAKFTQTLFVRFEANPELLRLQALLGLDTANQGFDPHLSLLYRNLPEDRQFQLAQQIRLPFATVTFDAIAAVRCRIPVESAADVAVWERIGTWPLEAAASER